VRCVGIGLHSGQPVTMEIRPAPAHHGIVFERADAGGRRVRALAQNVLHTRYQTTLSENGTTVATTEHLLSALYALGIDNALVEIEGAEVPILDGSAAPYLFMLREAGMQELGAARRVLVIEEPVSVIEDGCSIEIEPAAGLAVAYGVDYRHPIVGGQRYTGSLDLRTYVEEIAPARTFCFLREVEALRRQGLALGGSLDNAVVVGDDGVLNESLRFPDEFVRHKVLDLVGDLALLGADLVGHVRAERAGHRLHTRLVREILARSGSWSLQPAARAAASDPAPTLQPATASFPLAAAL
jgi:UDP-3-O-[3-hydroxymyristoyl] N-acetylglucosamine deacetylase